LIGRGLLRGFDVALHLRLQLLALLRLLGGRRGLACCYGAGLREPASAQQVDGSQHRYTTNKR
jgi:hypothetical protein